MSASSNITIVPGQIAEIGGFPITNAVFSFGIVMIIVLVFCFVVRAKLSLVPSRLQIVAEGLVEYLDGMLKDQFISRKWAKFFLPVMVALFLMIFVANQFTIIPLMQTIMVEGDVSVALFKNPTADLGLTLILSLLVILTAQFIAFFTSPLGHLGNYFKFKPLFQSKSVGDFFMNLIDFFLGLLDIVGELAKIASLSARLFANILAGEMMILIISGIAAWTAYIIPMPFFALGLLSGAIQTLVFVFLSIGFLSGTINAVEPETT
ncbi:MAG: FoF1 ATP synthase subunit a [bacterium]|nr:FoF1 ATP synthase subunit a [bacterium]